MSYAKRLRAARHRAGASQRQVADAIGCSHQAYSSWERGDRMPVVQYHPEIERVLGVEPPERAYPNEHEASGWGAKVRRGRQRRGWTQTMLADHVGVVENTVSRWERGMSEPDSGTRVKIACALDIGANMTTQQVVREARDAILAVHEDGSFTYSGVTADEIISAHVGGDMDRWASLCRRAFRLASEIEPDVSKVPDYRDREAA